MFAELFTPEQLTILTQIILIDLVLAGDNAIIIGMVASKISFRAKKKNYYFWNWWCGCFKNCFNFTDCVFASNNWAEAFWRFASSLYCLQIVCRCY